MAQDKNLPEGTDKIIPGAGETVDEVVVVEAVVAAPANASVGGPASGNSSPGGANATGSSAGTGATSRSGGSAGGGGQSGGGQSGGGQSGGGQSSGGDGNGGNSQKIMDKVRSGGEKISGQAADKARGFVSQGLDRSGDALSNVSRMVNDTASGIDERLGEEYGNYARRAAEMIDSTAQKIRSKDPDELIDDTRNFVRKSPGVALAGAAVVGFALARLVKTGIEAGTSGQGRDGDAGGGTGTTGSTGGTGAAGSTGSAGSTQGGPGGAA